MSQAIHPSASDSLPAKRAGALSRHLPPAGAFSLFLIIALWLVTRGTWRLMDAEDFTGFYDAQAHSLMQGRWDIPRSAIRPEAFIRDGKYYGYFGFVPAVLWMPLIKLWPDTAGHWARTSILVACSLGVIYSYLLLLRIGQYRSTGNTPESIPRLGGALFVLVAGLGSTTILLPSRAFPHHEALAWGASFAIASFYHLIGFLIRPRGVSMIVASIFAFAAFFSRASVGAGPVLALSLLAANIIASRWRSRPRAGVAARVITAPAVALNPWRTAPGASASLICIIAVATICSTYVGVNYAKFRTFFEAAPLKNYEQMVRHPDRLDRTGGKLMSLGNVRTTAWSYFRPDAARIGPNFPWIYAPDNAKTFPEARLDLVEPYTSVTTSMPALLLLGIVGLFATSKGTGPEWSRLSIPALSALAGGLAVLPADAISQRYLHDFFPFLIVSGCVGFYTVGSIRRRALRRVVWDGWIVLGAISIWLNLTFAVTYQRVIIWGVDREARLSFWNAAVSMDNLISRKIWANLQPPPKP